MDLLFTTELDLLTFGGQTITPWYRTTSASAQLKAVIDGSAIAVLPCYMVLQRDGLERLLSGEVSIERTYWLAVHKANSPRVRTLVQQIERHVHLDKSLFPTGRSACRRRTGDRRRGMKFASPPSGGRTGKTSLLHRTSIEVRGLVARL